MAAAREEWEELERKMRKILQEVGPEGVHHTMEYRDMRGAERSDVFWHMAQHVVNHGSYHRGQVTTMMRQLGAQPPKSMDLIMFYREKQERA